MLYIFWFLHQTTTRKSLFLLGCSCISFDSYIKPQLLQHEEEKWKVVYLLNPTSNHNSGCWTIPRAWLYIFWILHQTTTGKSINSRRAGCISFESYIKPQLSATPSAFTSGCISFESYIKPQPCTCLMYLAHCCISFESYIKPQLAWKDNISGDCCISFESYIKPQPARIVALFITVVYLLNPTSNHNSLRPRTPCWVLYIFWILHQTTTDYSLLCRSRPLYIFWILHQTTTQWR